MNNFWYQTKTHGILAYYNPCKKLNEWTILSDGNDHGILNENVCLVYNNTQIAAIQTQPTASNFCFRSDFGVPSTNTVINTVSIQLGILDQWYGIIF